MSFILRMKIAGLNAFVVSRRSKRVDTLVLDPVAGGLKMHPHLAALLARRVEIRDVTGRLGEREITNFAQHMQTRWFTREGTSPAEWRAWRIDRCRLSIDRQPSAGVSIPYPDIKDPCPGQWSDIGRLVDLQQVVGQRRLDLAAPTPLVTARFELLAGRIEGNQPIESPEVPIMVIAPFQQAFTDSLHYSWDSAEQSLVLRVDGPEGGELHLAPADGIVRVFVFNLPDQRPAARDHPHPPAPGEHFVAFYDLPFVPPVPSDKRIKPEVRGSCAQIPILGDSQCMSPLIYLDEP